MGLPRMAAHIYYNFACGYTICLFRASESNSSTNLNRVLRII